MKKTLSLILALLMSVSTATVALANDEVAIEDEVEVVTEEVVESPYVEAVQYLNTYGIYKGNGEDMDTESDITRWQMALFAARLSTGWVEDDKWEDGPQNSSEFTDLAGTYAENVYGAISYVNQMGIIEGYGDGTFGPTKGITYQDALTIAARTLGYKNLEYPWGYIQKAVELGLTEGVVDVAYTDTLTRGEVAQIIYNALFADTKAGTQIGLDVFGIMVADAIIVSSDRDVFTNTDYASTGFVGFQLIDDGELAGDVYYAKAADFDLEGHEDDLAVGASYEVYLEIADGGIVSVVKAVPNYVDTVWNFGKTDDEGVAVDGYAIEALFDNEYKLVSKYSANYIGSTFAAKGEMIVVDALGSIKVIEYTGKSNIGIDMNTGDIVKFAYDKENEKEIVVEETLWYWNEIVERYYQIVFDKDDEIGVKYMDADEEAKLLKAIKESTAVEVSKAGFAASAAIDEDSAYASLDIYEVNGKAYGIYEEYKFGYFKNSTTKSCDCSGDPARATYVLSDVITTVNSDGVITSTTSGVKFEKIVEGECKHGTAWINPNFAANATEDGYADGYVIYSADQQTGEVKIVKYINDCEDEDTYVAYGSVKAYSVADEYVVIGGEKFTFDYDNLEGSELVYVKQNKSSYSALLRDLFNQYIKYVVVDGEIVHIEAAGQKNDRLFVVEKYAGISSDGYIVVDGYFTNEAADLVRVRINTFDNNYTGDSFYYMNTDKAAKAFTKGALYAVSSTEEDGSLNVQIVGEVTENGYKLAKKNSGISFGKNVKIYSDDNAKNGYIYIDSDTSDDKAATLSRDKGYTYILIGAEDRDGFAPIAIYSGKVTAADWWAEGTQVTGVGDNIYVLVDANWQGFGRDMGTAGLVALLGDYYWTADFDGNDTEDWYLLGAAEYTVEVFNFYTASSYSAKATNLDLEEGYIYRTIDDTLVYDKAFKASELYTELTKNYLDTDAYSADYLFGTLTITAADFGDIKKEISYDVSQNMFGKDYADMVDEVAYRLITVKGDKITKIAKFDKDTLVALAKDAGLDTITLNGFYIYNNDTTDVIVYAYADVTVSTATKADSIHTNKIIEVGTDAYIDVTADAKVSYADSKVTSAKINSVTFSYIGEATKDTHHNVDVKGYYFGEAGTCDKEAWNTTVNGDNVYGTIEDGMYDDHKNEDICNLIKTVTVKFNEAVEIKDAWKQINVKFEANKDGEAVVYEITLCAIVEDGKLVFNVDYNNGCVEIGGAGVNFVDRATIVK